MISISLGFRVETCEYGVKEKWRGSESKNSSFCWQNPCNCFFGTKTFRVSISFINVVLWMLLITVRSWMNQNLLIDERDPTFTSKVCFFCIINAWPFIATFTQKKLVKIGWALLEHSSYCPNVLPYKYNTLRILMFGRK